MRRILCNHSTLNKKKLKTHHANVSEIFRFQFHYSIFNMFSFLVTGFGRSSRPSFSTDAMTAEKQLVRSIEEWRREMNLPKIILLGHSMGGFLATSYTMSYPDRYVNDCRFLIIRIIHTVKMCNTFQ